VKMNSDQQIVKSIREFEGLARMNESLNESGRETQ
jgi:hypothetical protein